VGLEEVLSVWHGNASEHVHFTRRACRFVTSRGLSSLHRVKCLCVAAEHSEPRRLRNSLATVCTVFRDEEAS
jgi:hypothetical protein